MLLLILYRLVVPLILCGLNIKFVYDNLMGDLWQWARQKATEANLNHRQLGTSHLGNVDGYPRHLQIPFGRRGGLGVAATGTK